MNKELKIMVIEGLKEVNIEQTTSYVLIPNPHEVNMINHGKGFRLDSNSKISFINVSDSLNLHNNLLKSINEFTNLSLFKKNQNNFNFEFLEEYKQEDLLNSSNKESYNLEISNSKVIIYSLSDKGLFYGIQTLIQMCKNFYLTQEIQNIDYIILPEIKIRDKPDFKIRGIAQDISRGQIFTLENAKRYIRIISHYKLNFYCLYIEDVFYHPKHPLIGKNRGALTSMDIKELDLFAKNHYVELVPIFECLGHVDNILQHQKYRDLGEFPSAQCLDISNQEIFNFLEDYISEISECFSTSYFHIGCDESFDLGKYNSKDLIEKISKSKAITEFYEKMYRIVKKNGNDQMIIYDDIVRKDKYILEHLNKDIIMMYWNYSPKKKFNRLENLFETGFKVIVSPAMLNWNRNFPDNINASKNIINLINKAYNFRNQGCLGVLTSTWGDQRYFSLRENEIFGAILTAGKSWNVNMFNYPDFKKEFGFLFYGFTKKDLEKFTEFLLSLNRIVLLTYRFAILLPPLFYTDLLKHPFSSLKFKPANKNYNTIKELASRCLKIYNEIQPHTKFEDKNLEYLEFGAQLAQVHGEKVENSIKVSEMLKNTNLSLKERKSVIEDLDLMKIKFKDLKEKYEILWLRAAKPQCLNENLRLFDQVINAYTKKIRQLRMGIGFKNPFLPSEWIWVREKNCPKKPRYFRKIININKPVKKAILQGLVCNHMKIYVNNVFIGDILGRMSLSLLPILLRVKTFDITGKLIIGKNIIAVEATNYDGYKGAFNIFSQLQYNDGEVEEIISDKSWKCFDKEILKSNSWREFEFNDTNWNTVKSYGKPPNLNGEILKPNLLNGESSLTQNYFGVQGYIYNILSIFVNKWIIKIFKFLIPIIVKIAKLFG